MYKKFCLDELCQINSGFLKNLKKLYTSQRYHFLKDFLKDVWLVGDETYFFESSDPIFRLCKREDGYCFVDEKDKIELNMSQDDLNKLHNILKTDKKVTAIMENKTIVDTLFEEFAAGDYANILGKPFLVYDIETIGNINDLRSMRFKLAYSIISNEDHSSSAKYRYVSEDNLKKFVDYVMDFDGYIVGYNNIHFDNPVIIYESGYPDSYIEQINAKTIDIMLFIWNLVGRRVGLDFVAKSLISVGKTLSSGKEGTDLLLQYDKTGDKKVLEKVKKYCQNDVRMTLGVMLYLLKYQRVYFDNEETTYTLDDFIRLSSAQKEKTDISSSNQLNIFSY